MEKLELLKSSLKRSFEVYTFSITRVNAAKKTFDRLAKGMGLYKKKLTDIPDIPVNSSAIHQTNKDAISSSGNHYGWKYGFELVGDITQIVGFEITRLIPDLADSMAEKIFSESVTDSLSDIKDEFSVAMSYLNIGLKVWKLYDCIGDHYDMSIGHKRKRDRLEEQYTNAKLAMRDLDEISAKILNAVNKFNDETDKLVNFTNGFFKSLNSPCKTDPGTLRSDLTEINGVVQYLKDQFDLQASIQKFFPLLENMKNVNEGSKTILELLTIQYPDMKIDDLISQMTKVGYQFPNEKWTNWKRSSIVNGSCSCEGEGAECVHEETRICLGDCLGPIRRLVNNCKVGMTERFHFLKTCKNRDASFRGSCVTAKYSTIEKGEISGRYVSNGVSQAQCYDDCKALQGARGCEFIQQSCFIDECVGPCFAVTEAVLKGDNIPDGTCYKFKETKGQSAPLYMRQVFEATQMAMTGVNKFNTKAFNTLTLDMFTIDKDLVQSQENGWKEMTKYQDQHQDSWGSNPSRYAERNPKSLAVSRSRSLLVYEPCNFASNWAYYHLMSSVTSFKWMPKEVKKGLGQSSAALGLASSFFHGSHTKLGQYFDNFMIKIIACILHQAYMQVLGVPPETFSVLTHLTSTRSRMTGVNMAQSITDMLKTEPSTNWDRHMKTIDVPSYEITFSALTLTMLTHVGCDGFLMDRFARQMMKILKVSRSDQKFVMKTFLPKIRHLMNQKNITTNERPDRYNLITTMAKLVLAFPFQESFDSKVMTLGRRLIETVELDTINHYLNSVSTLPLMIPVKFKEMTEEFPGKSQCQNQQPHSIWHLQSAKGMHDLFQLVDEIIGKQTPISRIP
eukprot:GFUD01006019.1.p1 GENE.GFUD01006019.1~~GFUD01006019.1.p1  ORF type:complete len:991 (+),score=124.96 GFUD01006019.1:438-2975(+)